jgi:hypothetical protein
MRSRDGGTVVGNFYELLGTMAPDCAPASPVARYGGGAIIEVRCMTACVIGTRGWTSNAQSVLRHVVT